MLTLMADYETGLEFNHKLLKGYREEEHLEQHVLNIYKTLEQSGFITIKSSKYITDEALIPTVTSEDGQKWIPIKEHRVNMLKIKFKINPKYKMNENEKDKVKIKTEAVIFIPKLIDGTFFILNGTKKYPIYQIVEESTYTTANTVTLKSLLMSLVMTQESRQIIDTNGEVHTGRVFILDLFKKQLNALYYFLSDLGYDETVKLFAKKKWFSLGEDPESLMEGEIAFQVNKNLTMFVNEKQFKKNDMFRSFVIAMHEMLEKCNLDKLDDPNFWLSKLGLIFTKNTNNKLSKAETVLKSFKRILDDTTKGVLRIDEENKENIFTLTAWIMRNYDELKKKDNFDLRNKRARLGEYIVFDLQKRFSNKTYTLLNSNKTINAQKISSLASINPNELITQIGKSSLVRYHNAVNDMDFFNVYLKWSKRGVQAMGESSKQSVNFRHRDINITQLKLLDLNTHSNNDPGMTGYFVPFAEFYDGMYFSPEGEYHLK